MNVPAALMTLVLKLPHSPWSRGDDDEQRPAVRPRLARSSSSGCDRRIDARREAVEHALHLHRERPRAA